MAPVESYDALVGYGDAVEPPSVLAQAPTRPKLVSAISRLVAVHTDTDKFGHAVSVHQQGSCWQLGFAGLAPGGSAEAIRVDVKELKKGGTFGGDGGGKFTHVFVDVTKSTFVERGASGGLTAGRRIVTSFAADPSGELRLKHAALVNGSVIGFSEVEVAAADFFLSYQPAAPTPPPGPDPEADPEAPIVGAASKPPGGGDAYVDIGGERCGVLRAVLTAAGGLSGGTVVPAAQLLAFLRTLSGRTFLEASGTELLALAARASADLAECVSPGVGRLAGMSGAGNLLQQPRPSHTATLVRALYPAAAKALPRDSGGGGLGRRGGSGGGGGRDGDDGRADGGGRDGAGRRKRGRTAALGDVEILSVDDSSGDSASDSGSAPATPRRRANGSLDTLVINFVRRG